MFYKINLLEVVFLLCQLGTKLILQHHQQQLQPQHPLQKLWDNPLNGRITEVYQPHVDMLFVNFLFYSNLTGTNISWRYVILTLAIKDTILFSTCYQGWAWKRCWNFDNKNMHKSTNLKQIRNHGKAETHTLI